ncbi:Pycsar system effector family protein [Actinokineospora sp. NPDC004072]
MGRTDVNVAELMQEEIDRADGAMVRTDTKAGLLLAVFSTITAGLTLLMKAPLHPVVIIALAIAAALFGTAVLLLLWTIRPHLAGSPLLLYGGMTAKQVKQHLAERARDQETWRGERLTTVARLATRKFRLVRRATTLIALALVVMVAAAVLGLVLKP